MAINIIAALKEMGNRPVPYTDVNEAKRIRPIKGLWTPKQMYKQLANTEKALNELRQHTDFIFQMDADVGPSGGDNSGKYFDQYSIMTKALDQFEMGLERAKKVTHK
jgi:hypothetical protein|tara:strand:+ start:245 stop:565 length:321 start_codon:yes stop_codon:yes gene_type:complete